MPSITRSIVSAATLAAWLLGPGGMSGNDARADGKLYRWNEPDGSLTFSPTPPDAGIPYVAVDPETLRAVDEAAPRDTRIRTDPERTVSIVTGARPGATDASAARSSPRPARAPAPEADRRGLTAPSSDTRPTGKASIGMNAGSTTATCEELGKRVVSLEQRMTSPLTADAMDATVVRMARYQYALESLCR